MISVVSVLLNPACRVVTLYESPISSSPSYGFKDIGNRLGPFDLVAVPIGAYEPRAMMRASHMNPEEAVQAAVDLGARRAVAIHFGTFDLSDEPLDEPPRRFRQATENAGLGPDWAWVLNIGETRRFATEALLMASTASSNDITAQHN